jgi:prephenate dehydrogenase
MTADEATPDHETADRSRDAARSTADPIDPVRAGALARLPSRIAFLGFGLIGGSIAMALRDAGSDAALAAWTPAGSGPDEAVRRGLIAAAARSPEEALDGAELVVLAGPPLAVVAALGGDDGPLAGGLADGATVTDVASTKGTIMQLAETTSLHFVGGHPMAGREVAGVGGASATLFVDRPWVIVPATTAREVDVDRVAALAAAVGARPIRMTATEHDAAVAAISHLPLVAAAALVEAVALSAAGSGDWPVARALAATGWRDMTRLARGDPEMGAGILETNRAAVAARLRAYRDAIDAWLEALEADGTDAAALRSRLEAARDALGGP